MPDTTIGGVAVGTPNSNMTTGNVGTKFLSLWSTLLDPNFSQKVYRQYSRGLTLRDVLVARGAARNLPANDLKTVEEQNYERPIKLKSAVAINTAGQSITIVLHADNYEGTRNPIQLRDTIQIPAQYLGSGQNATAHYVAFSSTTATLTNDTWVCHPLNITNNIGTAIPAGTQLAVGYNSWAPGEGQPNGKSDFPVQFSYTNGKIKTTVGLETGVQAYKMAVDEYTGTNWLINDLTMKAEFDHDRKEDSMFFNGQKNTNTSVLIGTSQINTDSSSYLKSCDGLTTLMDQYSMCNYYDTSFGISHLRLMVEGFIAQGFPTTDVAMYCGHAIAGDMQDTMMDYMQQYSSSDLYDRVKNKLGITPNVFNFNGVNFYVQPLTSFSNPSNIGVSNGDYTYEYPRAAICIPDNPITVKQFGEAINESIPNVGIGYVNYNGENCGKIMKKMLGMNGIEQDINIATDAEGMYYFWSSQPTLFGGAWNQKYYWRKQKSV
jgi:hypothetical protein